MRIFDICENANIWKISRERVLSPLSKHQNILSLFLFRINALQMSYRLLTFDILVTRNNVKCMAQTANAKIHTYTRDWQWLSSKWRGSFSRWIFRAYENKCVRKNCIREIKNLILQNVRPPTRRSTCTYFSRDSRHFSIKRNHAFCTDET